MSRLFQAVSTILGLGRNNSNLLSFFVVDFAGDKNNDLG